MKSLALMLLFVASCHTSFNGVDDGLHLEITLSKPTYRVGELVQVHITNRSTVPVYVDLACPPAVERLASGEWTDFPLGLACALDLRIPVELAPGQSTDAGIPTRVGSETLIDSGTYRGWFSVSGRDRSFTRQYSPGFDVQGDTHD